MCENQALHGMKKKFPLYMMALLIPFVMVQAFYALCGIWPYGGSSILTGDMDLELVNFYSYFINIFHSKNDFSYMLAKTLGGDYPGLAAYELHDPLLVILFLFPGNKIAAGIELLFALQISLAGFSTSVLLNERYRRSWASLIFSTAYAFSSFFFGFFVLTMYFTSLAILPLVIYFFLEYLEGKKRAAPYIMITALYIYMNYYIGFMLVIFLLLLYMSRIIEKPMMARGYKAFIMSGLTILALDGFFLVRTGLSLIGEKTTDGADYGLYRNFAMNQVFAQFFSGATRNELMPLIYCSVAAVLFALVYFLSDSYGIRQKLANIALLAALFVSMWINTLDAVWHGFNNPEGFYWRYSYFISIVVVILGYKGYIYLLYDVTDKKKALRKMGVVFALTWLYMGWLMTSRNPYMDRERQIFNALIIVGIMVAAIAACLGGRVRYVGIILLAIVSLVDMEYDARMVYLKHNANDGRLPEMEAFREDYERIEGLISYIKAFDKGFYRIEKDFDRTVNDPAMFDYIGLSHDSSTEKDEINHYLTNYGFTETVYYTFYNGGSTSFADAFLGVKYLATEDGNTYKPYAEVGEVNGYGVFNNTYALPMAYIAPDALAEFSFGEGNTFEKQDRLAGVWGMEGIGAGRAAQIYPRADSDYRLEGADEVEAGHFIRTDEEGYIVYDVHITEELPLYIYFAAPHRQSGEVFVNGESFDWYFTENKWNVLYAGTYEVGEDIEIRMQILKDDLEITEACFYYEDEAVLKEWSGLAQAAQGRISEVDEISSSHFCFNANVQDGEMVVLSIPYDTAWKVYCDGRRMSPMPAVEMLMGLKLPAGEHEIEMKYVPKGTLPGMAVSFIGVIMFVAVVLHDRRKPGGLD